MQIQLPPTEKDPTRDLVTRLKVAYRVFCAKKAIVIIENDIDVFNIDPAEVLNICSSIVFNLAPIVVEDIEQDVMIENLIASA